MTNEQTQAVEREAAVPGGDLEALIGLLRRQLDWDPEDKHVRLQKETARKLIAALNDAADAHDYAEKMQYQRDEAERRAQDATAPALRPPQPGVVTEELRRLSEAASPGSAYVAGLPWFQTVCGVLVGSPDPHAGYMIAETEGWEGEREEYLANEPAIQIASADEDAAFIAGCWNFVRGLLAAPSPGASVTASPADGDVIEALRAEMEEAQSIALEEIAKAQALARELEATRAALSRAGERP